LIFEKGFNLKISEIIPQGSFSCLSAIHLLEIAKNKMKKSSKKAILSNKSLYLAPFMP
jgi:hypothetical protein